jgi:hypothetical protein
VHSALKAFAKDDKGQQITRWVGWSIKYKIASFADIQYSIYAEGGGSEKVQNYADVIYG